MAAANPAKTLQDELTCSICLDYFKDPVSLDCDHNFCRACITQSFDTDISCPQCREIFPQRNLKLNRQLRNIFSSSVSSEFGGCSVISCVILLCNLCCKVLVS
uniref:RING-type domain-containing protein n=1 Tax=Chrysemys picta bellii TaxID=8478 RepID=A0A8C3HCR6_CHRPI